MKRLICKFCPSHLQVNQSFKTLRYKSQHEKKCKHNQGQYKVDRVQLKCKQRKQGSSPAVPNPDVELSPSISESSSCIQQELSQAMDIDETHVVNEIPEFPESLNNQSNVISYVPVCNPRPLEERSLYTKPEGSFSSNVKDLACLMLKHYASGSVYAE
ncbi:hypothetical protein G6F56_013966 [Rhizopus delemar]|nr:hypothetical protein G6F56_013966 [Rhizopus delemar]